MSEYLFQSNLKLLTYRPIIDKPSTIDPNKRYLCSPNRPTKGFNMLMFMVLNTRTDGVTPCYYSLEEIEEYIIEHLEELHQQNDLGMSPLFLAAINSSNWSNNSVVKMLLKYGANVDQIDNKGNSPLMYCSGISTNSSLETIDLLLRNNADINLRNSLGHTALYLSVSRTNTTSSDDIVRKLIENGADVNLSNDDDSPLMLAAYYAGTSSKPSTVQLLIDHRADINYENKKGSNALLFASLITQTPANYVTNKILLDANADPNKLSKGYSAFASVCTVNEKGNFDLVKLYLENGARYNPNDKLYNYPLTNDIRIFEEIKKYNPITKLNYQGAYKSIINQAVDLDQEYLYWYRVFRLTVLPLILRLRIN